LTTWPHGQLFHLFLTAWWISGIAAISIALHFRAPAQNGATWPSCISTAIFFLAAKYIAYDTFLSRIFHGLQIVTPFANLQCAAGAIVLAALLLLHLYPPFHIDDPRRRKFLDRLTTTITTLLLFTGTLEIERMFAASPPFARQVAFSIYWAAFAVALVIAGFQLAKPHLRYYALALYALTLVKVMLIDLAGIGTGYRILSFIGVGALLLATSVVYGKVSPRLSKAPAGV
jgi:uncharacterized membrane protein